MQKMEIAEKNQNIAKSDIIWLLRLMNSFYFEQEKA